MKLLLFFLLFFFFFPPDLERVFRNKGRETLINRGGGKIGENVLHIKLALYQIYRENSLLKIGRTRVPREQFSNNYQTVTMYKSNNDSDDISQRKVSQRWERKRERERAREREK